MRSRSQFGQKNCRSHAQRHGDEHSHGRRHHRSVHEGKRAELVEYRIPILGYQEMPAELMPRERRENPQLVDKHGGNDHSEEREDQRDQPGNFVGAPQTAQKRARAPGEARRWNRGMCGGHDGL